MIGKPSYVARSYLNAQCQRVNEIRLPIHTVSESNARDHYMVKAERTKGIRGPTELGCKGPLRDFRTMLAKGRPSRYLVLLTRIAPRKLDDDNIRGALKSTRDGVADALGINDRDPRVQWEYSQERGRAHEYAVRITVTEGLEP